LAFRKKKGMFGTSDIDAKKMMQRSKVSHGKFRVKRRNNLVKKGRRGRKNYVINIKKKILSVFGGFKDEKICVAFGRNEANGLDKKVAKH
jgi:hypothetical protein